MSPFISHRGFDKEKIISIFQECSVKALGKLKEIELEFGSEIESQDYFIFFDKIITDFAQLEHGMNCIEFWASVWKYELFNEPYVPGVASFLKEFIEFMSKH